MNSDPGFMLEFLKHVGAIWGPPLGSNFGAIGLPSWSDLGTHLGRIWELSLDHILEPAASPLLLYLLPSFAGSAGVRVIAYN